MTTARRAAHLAIRGYQLTLSGLVGRQCRHWPSCSAYADEAIARHGLWPGGWMGLARLCRCGPFGTHGVDLVPARPPEGAVWYRPWAYGRWRGVEAPPFAEEPPFAEAPPFTCEAVEDGPLRTAPAPGADASTGRVGSRGRPGNRTRRARF